MIPNVKIHIGQYFATKNSTSISTVLGSCVSVCLFDPVMKIGGMNHILHSGESLGSIDDSGRYGVNAMELLINEMISLGAMRNRLVAKVFGGGNILGLSNKHQQGHRNVDFVLNFLKVDEIQIVSQNTGGRFSRKISAHRTRDAFSTPVCSMKSTID